MQAFKQVISIAEYLQKFSVCPDQNLFGPNWSALLDRRCPICGNRLRQTRDQTLFYCRGVKHGQPFRIRQLVMKQLVLQLQ